MPLGGTGFVRRDDEKKPTRKRPAKSDADKDTNEAAEREEPFRAWTDNTGEFHVSAKLESADDKSVQLRKADDSVITVPLERLKRSDRAYVDRFRSKQSQREKQNQ